MTDKIIEFDKVVAGYTPSLTILNETTLDARKGEITLLIGPNKSIAKSIRWIVISNRSPAPALSLYCRQAQLVSGQSRNRWLRKCRGVPSAPLFRRRRKYLIAGANR